MKRSQSGQGLMEIIIVTLLISCSVLALLGLQNALAYADALAQQQTEATLLAELKISSLRDFQVLNTQSPYAAYQNITSGVSTTTGTNASYTITWTVRTYTSPNYKSLNVVVSWNDVRGNAKTIRLLSYVAGIEPAYSASVMY